MVFNDRTYTIDALVKQLGLVELHCKDGSAVEAGCKCIETKHLYNIEGLSEEGVGFALSEKERKFFLELGDLARNVRKKLESEDFSLHGVMENPQHGFVELNPHGRLYLPHGLTECERERPNVVHRLAKCIKEVEEREDCRPPYEKCSVNPVAVCRASVRCPS